MSEDEVGCRGGTGSGPVYTIQRQEKVPKGLDCMSKWLCGCAGA